MVSCSNLDLNSLHSTLVIRKKGALIPYSVSCKIILQAPTSVNIRPTEIGGRFVAANANLKILI